LVVALDVESLACILAKLIHAVHDLAKGENIGGNAIEIAVDHANDASVDDVAAAPGVKLKPGHEQASVEEPKEGSEAFHILAIAVAEELGMSVVVKRLTPGKAPAELIRTSLVASVADMSGPIVSIVAVVAMSCHPKAHGGAKGTLATGGAADLGPGVFALVTLQGVRGSLDREGKGGTEEVGIAALGRADTRRVKVGYDGLGHGKKRPILRGCIFLSHGIGDTRRSRKLEIEMLDVERSNLTGSELTMLMNDCTREEELT
jgi:hypothetical protein